MHLQIKVKRKGSGSIQGDTDFLTTLLEALKDVQLLAIDLNPEDIRLIPHHGDLTLTDNDGAVCAVIEHLRAYGDEKVFEAYAKAADPVVIAHTKGALKEEVTRRGTGVQSLLLVAVPEDHVEDGFPPVGEGEVLISIGVADRPDMCYPEPKG